MTTDLLPSEVARFDEVCRFGQDQLEPIARCLALGFADDPVWQWAIGVDRTLTLDEAMPFARAMVANTAPVDEMHGFRHHGAVALWRAPEELVTEQMAEERSAQSESYFAAFAAQVGDRRELLGGLGTAMHDARPTEPHWYLSLLAVTPDRQGQGLGGQVLEPMIARCDRLGIATYLESSNPRNHSFYLRLGYREASEVQSGDSPTLMCFHRPAG